MKTFAEKLVDKKAFTELDLEYPFYESGGQDECNEVLTPSSILYTESPSIDIDIVISTLQNMKELGANRVYIADHCDHHGYYFYGVKLSEL